MRILVLATKAPWPPSDGGRLLLLQTLQGLAAAGHRVTLVVPAAGGERRCEELAAWCELRLVDARPPGRLWSGLRAQLARRPASIVRHSLAPVRREVERLLAERRFDVVHAEQLQALPRIRFRVPLVLRAQNVESDLWQATSRLRGGWRGKLLAVEARRLAAWEGAAVRRVDLTVALTRPDAERLRQLGGVAPERVAVVAAPFPPELPAAETRLAGEPAVMVLGSAGWLPNADGAAWFRERIWPAVRHELPGARLHEPSPADSREAFAPGSILAVPLRIASGVRMKILEAWARGIPVVGTPEAVAGLEAVPGRELLVAQDPAGFAGAFARLHREPGLAASLIAAGRSALRERHDPAALARELAALYGESASSVLRATGSVPSSPR